MATPTTSHYHHDGKMHGSKAANATLTVEFWNETRRPITEREAVVLFKQTFTAMRDAMRNPDAKMSWRMRRFNSAMVNLTGHASKLGPEFAAAARQGFEDGVRQTIFAEVS